MNNSGKNLHISAPLYLQPIFIGGTQTKLLSMIAGLCGQSKKHKKGFLSRELYVRTATTVVFQILVTQGKEGSHQPRTLPKINFAKQNLHGGYPPVLHVVFASGYKKKPISSSSFLYSRSQSYPFSLAPTWHPRSQNTEYLLIAQYLCCTNSWVQVSELYPIVELAEIGPR